MTMLLQAGRQSSARSDAAVPVLRAWWIHPSWDRPNLQVGTASSCKPCARSPIAEFLQGLAGKSCVAGLVWTGPPTKNADLTMHRTPLARLERIRSRFTDKGNLVFGNNLLHHRNHTPLSLVPLAIAHLPVQSATLLIPPPPVRLGGRAEEQAASVFTSVSL
ncbi:hypothetical protein LZ31DRAFT_46493 [Colletotrichum somersetense]|nr:hypothetical protein LZ31DRAFT_46493 [Colletotrichum somersetense]